MITFLFVTRNDARALARSLAPLVHDAIEGHVSEVIVYDHDSADETAEIADAAGCHLESATKTALRDIAARSRSDWLILLEPGARLRPGWQEPVFEHMSEPDARAARFRPYLPDWRTRLAAAMRTASRTEQALLLPKALAGELIPGHASSLRQISSGRGARRLDAEVEPPPKPHV